MKPAGQTKFAEAEPLLRAGYERIRTREAKLPASKKIYLTKPASESSVSTKPGQDRRGESVASQADPA